MTHRPDGPAPIPRTPSLGAIFNQHELMLIRQRTEFIQRTRIATQMHRDDGFEP